VPENLKAAVVRAAFGTGDRHQLALNHTYRELARHHGCKIDPTPVRKEKKCKVEAGVKSVRRNLLAAANPDSVTASNTEPTEWLLQTAGQRIHASTGKRPLTIFEQVEQAALLELPSAPNEPVAWKQATVHAESHL